MISLDELFDKVFVEQDESQYDREEITTEELQYFLTCEGWENDDIDEVIEHALKENDGKFFYGDTMFIIYRFNN